jgi:predicted ArsR family transcriptional regulator
MTPPSFRLRSETIALLLYIDEHDFPVSASELSGMLGMHEVPMRRRLSKLYESGYLGMERRYSYDGYRTRRSFCRYFWTTTKARNAIRERTDVKPLTPKTPPKAYLINSVFSLGVSNAR